MSIQEVPIPPGHTRVYRSVSEAEFREIIATGEFRQGRGAMGGKWFGDTPDVARAHATANYPQGNYRIVEADVPDDAPSLYIRPNLDGRGPARYLHIDDLRGVIPRPYQP